MNSGQPLSAIAILSYLICFPHASFSAECLERNNDDVELSHNEVYTNGKLKFKIEGWYTEGTYMQGRLTSGIDVNNVLIKSNSKALNGKHFLKKYYQHGEMTTTDTELCPGVEITITCTGSGDPWDCLISEF
jgi:hypothetical protein